MNFKSALALSLAVLVFMYMLSILSGFSVPNWLNPVNTGFYLLVGLLAGTIGGGIEIIRDMIESSLN